MFPKDVTVIIPTLAGEGGEFVRCLNSILACSPAYVYIVTPHKNVSRLVKELEFLGSKAPQIIGVDKPNKRLQMIQGLKRSTTALTIFADDDVVWPNTFLHFLIAAFEDPKIGAAGTCQRLHRVPKPSCWNILGAIYLERRNFEISATTRLDGGISCLSGRTSAHRTAILKNDAFIDGFANEVWLGGISLVSADDDNFLTRWMVNHGWKLSIQYCKEAELTTTLEDSHRFLYQCVRWARTNWRSNITSMFVEKTIWRYEYNCSLTSVPNTDLLSDQPWCCYALHLTTFNPPAAIMDSLLAYLLYHATQPMLPNCIGSVMTVFAMWLLFTKIVKLLPHFYRYPNDIKFIPIIILFGYFHGLIKIYALLTLHKVRE